MRRANETSPVLHALRFPLCRKPLRLSVCLVPDHGVSRTTACDQSRKVLRSRGYATLGQEPLASSLSPTNADKALGRALRFRDLLDRIGPSMGIRKMTDWYSSTKREVKRAGGREIFDHYRTLEEALRAAYPEFPWESARFPTPRGFWRTTNNQKEVLDRVGKELGIKQPSDWYSVSRKALTARGAEGLFRYYPSLESALKAVYPEYKWESWKFMEADQTPRGFWREKGNLFKAIEWAEKKLDITKHEDWYSVNLADLREIGFPKQVSRTQLAELLAEKYPDQTWDKVYLLRGRFAQQKRLEKAVAALFPDVEIIINARSEAGIKNPETNEMLELDVYIPSLNMAFEYQEKHHYTAADYSYQPVDYYASRDIKKLELAKEKGITLLTVPCWWDGQQGSLAATIKRERPDLLAEIVPDGQPIPASVPPHFFDKVVQHVENVGQPITACFFTFSSIDPTNWWLFEKYDGVRGFWNPLKKTMYSRNGKPFVLPQEILDSMPQDIFLDGELWFGRETFQDALKLSQRMDPSALDWTGFKMMVFDMPADHGNYAQRYQKLVEVLADKRSPYIELAPYEQCTGQLHLETFFQDVVDKGGEGVILRDPNSPYQQGRSAGYLKHKRFRDAEAKIVRPIGNHQWECELPNGIRFNATAGTLEFVKRWNPQPGQIVSFKHHGFLLATKKPKLASLYRIRDDITWEDVKINWKEQKSTPTAYPFRRPLTKRKPRGYWQNAENVKKFFVELAQAQNFDPSNVEAWHAVSYAQIRDRVGGATCLAYFNGSLKAALSTAFPDLPFQFKDVRPKGFWHDVENARKFLIEYAEEEGFDHQDPMKWLEVPVSDFAQKSGANGLLRVYGSFQDALKTAFPDLDWKFKPVRKHRPYDFWESIENRKNFFMEFAHKMGFDYTNPENWVTMSREKIIAEMGRGPLPLYDNSLALALRQTFPEMKFKMPLSVPRKKKPKFAGRAELLPALSL